MGDVNLGSIKAKLELDAKELERSAAEAEAILKRLGASAEQTQEYLTEMMKAPAANREAFLTPLRESAAEFEKNNTLIGDLKNKYGEWSEKISQTGVALGIATGAATAFGAAILATYKSLFDSAVAASDYIEKLDKMSEKTGLSVDMLEGLGKAATESNISLESVTRAVVKMEQAIAKDSKAFAELGLSLRDLKNASPDEQLRMTVTALEGVGNVSERNALSMQILGRSFAEAQRAVDDYLAAGDRFVKTNDEQRDALRAFDKQLDATKTAWGELMTQIGAAVASQDTTDLIQDIGGAIRDLAKTIQEHREAISWFFTLVLGGPGAVGAKLGAPIHKWTEAAAQMAGEAMGTRNEEVLPKVNPKLSTDLFSAKGALSGIKGPTPYYDELQKQDMERHAEAEKLSQKAVADEQKRQDTIASLLQRARTSAAIEGKKIMDTQFKEAEKHVKDQMRLVVDQKREEERLAKQFAQTELFIQKQSTDILQARLRDGTLSFREQWDLRKQIIISSNEEQIAAIQKVAQATTDPRQKAALEALVNEWDKVTDAELRAAEKAERYAHTSKLLGDFSNILGGVADLFDALGISADSALGKVVSGLQAGTAAAQNYMAQTTTAGKIGAGLSAVGTIYKTGQQKGALAGAAAGALTGAAIGSVVPVIGTVAGGVIGAAIGLIGGLRKPEFKKIASDVGKSWGVAISESLAKEIEGIAKANKISRSLAELLDVSKIIGESGKDPREFTGKINDLMNAIAAGSVPAAQGLAELGRAFNQVADAALKSGNIGDKALVGLIKRARELGEVTPEMKQFIGGQLDSAVEGVKKLLEVMPADTAAKAGSSGALLAATFNAIAAEQGIVAASAALGPAYDSLMGQITKAGLAIPTALQAIGRQVELGKNKEFQAASGAAAATSQVLSGLGNAGYMDTGILTASADVAKQTFDQAKNAGATDKEAYQAIGGLLSDIKNASVQSGQEISGLAQELISGAQAEGVIIQGNQLSVLVDIRNILAGGGYTPSGVGVGGGTGASGPGGGFGGQGSEGGGVTGRAADVFTAPPSVPYRERELRHFQGGSHGVQDFGAGTLALLHGREAVHTEKQLSEMGRPSIGFSPTFVNSDPTHTNESRAALSAFQVDDFVRQVINNPLFQQILRDQGLRG